MARTLNQINKDIKTLEAKREKEFKRMNAKYKKPVDNLFKKMDAECQKHPEKWREIQKRYLKKIKKLNEEWYQKGTKPIYQKYQPKLIKLAQEKENIYW